MKLLSGKELALAKRPWRVSPLKRYQKQNLLLREEAPGRELSSAAKTEQLK